MSECIVAQKKASTKIERRGIGIAQGHIYFTFLAFSAVHLKAGSVITFDYYILTGKIRFYRCIYKLYYNVLVYAMHGMDCKNAKPSIEI